MYTGLSQLVGGCGSNLEMMPPSRVRLPGIAPWRSTGALCRLLRLLARLLLPAVPVAFSAFACNPGSNVRTSTRQRGQAADLWSQLFAHCSWRRCRSSQGISKSHSPSRSVDKHTTHSTTESSEVWSTAVAATVVARAASAEICRDGGPSYRIRRNSRMSEAFMRETDTSCVSPPRSISSKKASRSDKTRTSSEEQAAPETQGGGSELWRRRDPETSACTCSCVDCGTCGS